MAGALLRACALTALLSGLLPAPAASWAAPASWKVVHQQTDDSYGTAARPSIRYSHAAVVVGDDMVTSHGYFYDRQKRSEPVWLSDLWVMDLKPRYRWSRLRGNVSQSEVVGAYGAGHLPSAPSGRFGHSLVALNSRALYLYGGQDGGYSRHGQNNYVPGFEFEELWRLDLPALSWSHVPLAAEGTASPGARYRHAVALLGGTMFLYGGISPGQGDVWAYDTAANSWARLAGERNSAAGGPGRRIGASLLPLHVSPSRYGFLLYGGRIYDDPAAEKMDPALWFFDVPSRQWRKLQTVAAAAEGPFTADAPPARIYQSATHMLLPGDGSGVAAATAPASGGGQWFVGFISGGTLTTPSLTCAADSWAFTVDCDVTTVSWTRLPDLPFGVYDHSLVAHTADGALFAFGGHLCTQSMGSMPFYYTNAVTMLDASALLAPGAVAAAAAEGRACASLQPAAVNAAAAAAEQNVEPHADL